MQPPKWCLELCLSPCASREVLATAVASFRFTRNEAHPLLGTETTKNLKPEKPTLVFTQKVTKQNKMFWGKVWKI